MTHFPFLGWLKIYHVLFESNIWWPIVWLLTADAEIDGVTSLSVRVLKAAVESVVAKGHLGQYQSGAL